jgi:hypothetical protein
MRFSNIKPVIIGIGAAAAVIAITGAASGSGVGGVFNLGKVNRVNATSSLTGSTRHPMLSVTNKGRGTALSLHVAGGKAPLSVNSSARVANLNASLLGGLAAGQFVQGGGQSRSFGFTLPTGTEPERQLLSVRGFGTVDALCSAHDGTGVGTLSLITGSHAMDAFSAFFTSQPTSDLDDVSYSPDTNFAFGQVLSSSVNALWEQVILRYTTGSGRSMTTHIATLQVAADASPTTCDFDASAIIGPGTTGP